MKFDIEQFFQQALDTTHLEFFNISQYVPNEINDDDIQETKKVVKDNIEIPKGVNYYAYNKEQKEIAEYETGQKYLSSNVDKPQSSPSGNNQTYQQEMADIVPVSNYKQTVINDTVEYVAQEYKQSMKPVLQDMADEFIFIF